MVKKVSFDVLKFGMACGLTLALGLLILGLIASFSGMWIDGINLIGMFYLGYAPTAMGSIVGAVWGFFDGLIGGAIFAWIYNKLIGQ